MSDVLTMLNAYHGAAFLIECRDGDKVLRIVVDGGPKETKEQIAYALHEFGEIDLILLTHFDEDHIAGIIEYLKSYECKVKEFRGNNFESMVIPHAVQVSNIGFKNAYILSLYLNKKESEGSITNKWKTSLGQGDKIELSKHVNLHFFSPSPNTLIQYNYKYRQYIEAHKDKWEYTVASKRVVTDAQSTIAALSINDDRNTIDEANLASLAFLISTPNMKALFLGDSDIDVVADGIESIRYSVENPLTVDYVILSHHGSKNNISFRFLSLIRCNKYLISTCGGKLNSYHPDRKTLALCINHKYRNKDEKVKFFLNYPLDDVQKRTLSLLSAEEQEEYNCSIEGNHHIFMKS